MARCDVQTTGESAQGWLGSVAGDLDDDLDRRSTIGTHHGVTSADIGKMVDYEGVEKCRPRLAVAAAPLPTAQRHARANARVRQTAYAERALTKLAAWGSAKAAS